LFLFREICETNFVAAQADNASAKTMATFIIDMARLDPHIIRTHIDPITDLLTAEVNQTGPNRLNEYQFLSFRVIIFVLLH
jgi:hypothetical protein